MTCNNDRIINLIKESINESRNEDEMMTVKDLKYFMEHFTLCPNCKQHMVVKDGVKHTNIACKDKLIIRECLDCGTIVIYNKQITKIINSQE